MKLAIHTQLDYFFAGPTDVLLQLEAAAIPEQTIERAYIDISPVHHFARVPAHDCIGDRLWLNVEGRLTVDYTSTVSINRICADIAGLAAVPPHLLPGETVQYLFASRYCPSDQFGNFVDAQFGSLAGGARVQAIHDWIEQHFAYVAGSSTAATGAIDTFVMRQGVCRDFAHVMVTLTRACGIPARFASVYAPKVSPQDFHAVAEVFLDGTWYLVDATGMASGEDVAKIAVGRDAADTSFLTSYGQALLNRQTVEVTVLA
jgi:transglutaminase-like putative cysteine protease